ncbi:hypothetical protein JW721_01575 [Candidatus Micrarchaeota archaeon]|nr:hypothetical protein [Candidatus Micrarchaeota archaeon]
MAKHAMLPPKMLELFDFAAENPMQGPLMTSQMMMPAVLLQMFQSHEQDIHRFDQMLAGDAEKNVQEQHEERTSASLQNTTEGEGMEQETESTSFSLIYYNPETEQTHVVREEVKAKISDYAVKKSGPKMESSVGFRAADYMQPAAAAIEVAAASQAASASKTGLSPGSPEYLAAKTAMAVDQSVGQKSTYPMYMNVASPLAREVIDPIRLEIALKKIEIETPKPFGGAAAVAVAPQVFDKVEEQVKREGIEPEIVAVDRIEAMDAKPEGENPEIVALEILHEVEGRRVESIHQLELQIKAFEKVIEELEITDESMEKVLRLLPPLSKERYLALLEHEKKIAETLVVDLLIADLEFLVIVRDTVKKNGLRGMIETLKKLGKATAPIIQKSGGGGDDDEGEPEVVPLEVPSRRGASAKKAPSKKKGAHAKKRKSSSGKKENAGGLLGKALSRLRKKK